LLATDDKSPENRIVAVTGGSDGLGLAIATEFAQTGATVVLLARNRERLAVAAENLNRAGHKAIPVVADVTDDNSVEKAVAQISTDFGRLDVWVNNVGKSTRASVLDCSIDTYNDLMQLNFFSVVRCSERALPLLRQSSGSLINIGSLASKTAWPWMAPYSASKHALAAYTHQLRLEGPSNVNFLHVMPGPIRRVDAGTRYDSQLAHAPEAARKPGAGAKVKGVDPKSLAKKIVRAEQRRQTELVAPFKARFLFAIAQLSPVAGDWLLNRFMTRGD
jgi:NAD(P)-dependent dehydrogenase (short-subunit alcohol dehydrogenase family)